MPLTSNQLLYEYRIECVLGQGAFGVVYLAHDTLLDRPVAIKELTITRQTDETAFKRFLQEARAAGSLNHPHIVTVHALKVVEPTVYLVMEYLAGGSLRTMLERHGPLPVEDAVRIAADVCEGLAAAHARGIVHRDVKPDNILLTGDGQAKVGDFGIAHVPRGAGGTYLSQLTGTGFQPGTLLYMSPEQVRGQPVDGRSDVYQVGALLYEMLTGRHYVDMGALERQARDTAGSNAALFQARLYELLAEAVCERKPAEVCQMLPGTPEWASEVVAEALAKGVEERPTAVDLGRALQEKKIVQILAARPPDVTSLALAEEHFKRGVQLRQEEKWAQAIEELEQAIEISPGYGEAYYELAKLYRRQGASAQASAALQQAIRADANSVFHEGDWDMLLSLTGDKSFYLDVLSAYQRTVALIPDSAETHYNFGRALELESDNVANLKRAIAEYQQALSLRPDYPEAYVAMGNAYLDLDWPEDALLAFQRAAGMEWPKGKPSSMITGSLSRTDAYLGLVKAQIKLGQFDQANATALLAWEMNPEDGHSIVQAWLDAYKEQGGTYLGQDRFDLAVTVLLQAAAVYSQFPKESMSSRMLSDWASIHLLIALSYYRLGLQYLNRRARNEAGQLLDRALDAWKIGYSILPNPDEKDQKVWNDRRSVIESARKKAKGGWGFW